MNGGHAGRYSRYDEGYIANPTVVAFIDLMMVSVVAGVIELCVFPPTLATSQPAKYNEMMLIPSSILYFITLVTFSTIVYYHRREHRHCTCVGLETDHGVMESDSKTNSEKAQTEPEPLIYSGDEASPENGSLDLTTPESTTPEEVVYEEEQRHTEPQGDLIA